MTETPLDRTVRLALQLGRAQHALDAVQYTLDTRTRPDGLIPAHIVQKALQARPGDQAEAP